jgi:hypothetical protein
MTASDRVSNHVYDVVREAIWAGVSPEEFKIMVRECWRNAIDDEARHAIAVFSKP